MNSFGQVVFDSLDVGTVAYQNYASSAIDSLNRLKTTNNEAFQSIIKDVSDVAQISTSEFLNSNGEVSKGLSSNAVAVSAITNSMASQTGKALADLAISAGDVITSLGDVISEFNYTLSFDTVGSIDPGWKCT